MYFKISSMCLRLSFNMPVLKSPPSFSAPCHNHILTSQMVLFPPKTLVTFVSNLHVAEFNRCFSVIIFLSSHQHLLQFTSSFLVTESPTVSLGTTFSWSSSDETGWFSQLPGLAPSRQLLIVYPKVKHWGSLGIFLDPFPFPFPPPSPHYTPPR